MLTDVRSLRLFGLAFGFLAALILGPTLVSAHAQLISSSPAANSLIPVPPSELNLSFSEAVDLDSIVVTILDENGAAIATGTPRFVSGSDRQVIVPVSDISVGTYTVSWTDRSATDGHTVSGSYAFRVGGSSVAPAAATVEGQRPESWGVLTRWLAFLSLAPAIGLLLAIETAKRRRIIGIGLIVATIVTALEPLLLANWPPGGAATTDLGTAIGAEPTGWWIRLIGLVLAAIALWLPRLPIARQQIVPVLGLIALAGYALTSHAAGRATYAWAATGVSFLHNAAVAIWIGTLALIVLAPLDDRLAELRAFSKRALPLALIAVAAGIVMRG